MLSHIKGLDKVMNNLNKEINKIKGASMEGLIEATILIENDMDRTPPLIPIQYGNLRGSFFRDPRYVKGDPTVRFGFSASYAWWVHENVGANFRRPGAGAKFLEAALKRNQEEILKIIRETVVKR
jgi:hypothetical protein